jgi:hypothetical protein
MLRKNIHEPLPYPLELLVGRLPNYIPGRMIMYRKQRGYWQDWQNVENALKPLIDKLGYFPTSKELI